MAERIDIELNDKIDAGVQSKILAIASASEKADVGLSKLKASLDSIGSSGLSKLQEQLSLTASATSALAASQERLISSSNKLNTQQLKTALSEERLAQASLKTEAAQARLAQANQKTANAAMQGQLAQQRLATETERTAAAAARAESAKLRLARAQETSNKASSNAIPSLRSMVFWFAAVGTAIYTIKNALEGMDAFTIIQNKLRNVTESGEQLATVTKEIFDIANRARAPVENVAQSFQRFDLALRQLGVSQDETLRMTETITKALISSGATTGETSAALLQLSQAFNKGKLDGDEFRTVMELMPAAANAIAKQLGVTRGELLKLAPEGKITADVMRLAFADARDEIEGRFAKTIPTVSQAFAVLGNEATRLFGEFNAGTGITASLSKGILSLAESFGKLADDIIKARKGSDDLLTSLGRIDGTKVNVVFDFQYVGMTPDQMIEQWGVGKGGKAVGGFFSNVVQSLKRQTQQLLNDPFLTGKEVAPTTDNRGLQRKLEDESIAATNLAKSLKDADSANERMSVSSKDLGDKSARLSEVFKDAAHSAKTAVPQTEKLKEQIANLKTAIEYGQDKTGSYAKAIVELESRLEKAEKRAQGSTKALKGLSEAQREAYKIAKDVASPLEKMNLELERLDYWYKYGAIDADLYAKAIAKIKVAAGDAIKPLEQIYSERSFMGKGSAMDAGIMRGAPDAPKSRFEDFRFNPEDQARQYAIQAQQQQDFLANTQRMYAEIDRLRQADVISERSAMEAKAQILAQQQQAQWGSTLNLMGQLSSLQNSKIRELAVIGKTAAVAQATITGILAVQRALAGPPGPPWSFVIAGVTAAMTAANVAQIMTTPAYETGGYTGNLPTNRFAGFVHGQEFVVNARATAQNREVLEAMNRGARAVSVSGGSTRAGALSAVNIYNYGTSKTHDVQITPEEIRIIARDEAETAVWEKAPKAVARDMHDTNGETARAMKNNYKAERLR